MCTATSFNNHSRFKQSNHQELAAVCIKERGFRQTAAEETLFLYRHEDKAQELDIFQVGS